MASSSSAGRAHATDSRALENRDKVVNIDRSSRPDELKGGDINPGDFRLPTAMVDKFNIVFRPQKFELKEAGADVSSDCIQFHRLVGPSQYVALLYVQQACKHTDESWFISSLSVRIRRAARSARLTKASIIILASSDRLLGNWHAEAAACKEAGIVSEISIAAVGLVEHWPQYKADALVEVWSQTLGLESESQSQGNRTGDVFGKSAATTKRSQEPAYIFIAGPGEMQPHREAIRDYLERFKKFEGRLLPRTFEPLDWPHDSTSGVGRAQQRITEEVLQPNEEQLVLMIFLIGSRIGTATGGFESGTLEEYQWAMKRRKTARWPEIKVAFEPIDYAVLNDVTSDEEKDRLKEQFEKVEKFQKELKKSDEIYLTRITSKKTFQKDVLDDLARWLCLPSQPWAPKSEIPEQKDVGY